MSATPVLALRDVSKSFGSIEVLHGVTLALEPGTVHALIGENGAGKSTTMKIMAGYQLPSKGAVELDGAAVRFDSLHEGEMAGIVMIHQEFNLAEQLTVEQNIFLGRELKRGPLLDKAEMRRRTRDYLDRVACNVSPDALVSRLSNSDKQMVEIAKALSRDARVLIMDEPTAVLTKRETDVLFKQVAALRAAGTAVLFTSHKLDEVAEISDHVTIMRDGAVVQSSPTSEITEDEMATAMVGRDVSDLYPAKPGVERGAPEVLSVENLSVPGFASNVSFSLRQGEILGLGGLIGSGRTEVMEGLAALRPASAERVTLFGEPVQFKRPSDAQQAGLCYLTEDRKLRGLLLERGMRENLTLQNLHKFGGFLIDRNAEETALTEAIGEFDIRAGSRDVRVGNMSGGNQQKLLLAKIMLSEPRILIVDEPTRGIDIGTKQQIYAFLRKLADQGHAIIVITSEMPELIGLADRVMVMRLGEVSGTLNAGEITEDAIVRLSMGLRAEQMPMTA
ncbi:MULTISPECIES: sugar ABC transporter ATP-binding protein [Sulfitobacter]|uniref:sugar ABC transporter ATP-binding protein n=1 Tax=Sulfitobacter TaxID=60136 RepID=UPI002306F5DE|nr:MULTISPECIES: sugar ABC transporter ATP-binding protein [Sulfitobacter]MDF3384025.1 sugar ABC transporter ATP-binding protein [Sulfitobacter sp. Ks11]MDF3387513.1 sugar ABC transporter ATP-binding protein [Sulfitobacter sp. M85]MDF3390856.1 sugar ABC transporter ATP-binding protein [Sulfitobacter sp. Ks16]MDF3401404.1 sugar ABC transporter ATP-binding protein [Sulfitobacter sp. KE39]MDF3404810.1 sugar ABC transporter ATP-binding protein [Sulfitobacter sp. Ks35]